MYKSPIEVFYQQVHVGIEESVEDAVYKAVKNVGSCVNKEELVQALMYDRDQYERGFEDAKVIIGKQIIEEVEKLTKCPYGDKCLGANCPSNTDCMLMGEHVIEIVKEYCGMEQE